MSLLNKLFKIFSSSLLLNKNIGRKAEPLLPQSLVDLFVIHVPGFFWCCWAIERIISFHFPAGCTIIAAEIWAIIHESSTFWTDFHVGHYKKSRGWWLNCVNGSNFGTSEGIYTVHASASKSSFQIFFLLIICNKAGWFLLVLYRMAIFSTFHRRKCMSDGILTFSTASAILYLGTLIAISEQS